MENATATPIGRIMLKNVRLSFADGVFEAKTIPGQEGSKPKFNCGVILPPDHPQLDDIRAKMQAVARAKWGDKWEGVYKAAEKQDKLALHDGDLKPNYDGYPGNFFLSPNSDESAPPTVIDRDRTPLTKRSGRIYSGCYANVSIELWAQDNQYGKRINAQLRGVQFFKDGDAFSAARPADTNEFDDVSDGSDADDIV